MEVSGAYGFGPPQNSEASPPLSNSTAIISFSAVVYRFYGAGRCENIVKVKKVKY